MCSAAALLFALVAASGQVETPRLDTPGVPRGAEPERQSIDLQQAALKARDDALLTVSKFLADAAMRAIERHEPVTGLLLALEALPDATSEDEIKRTRPYWGPAEVALESARRLTRESLIVHHQSSTVQSVAITPDGARIVSGSRDAVHVRNGTTGVELLQIRKELGSANERRVAITSDGLRVVTQGPDNSIAIWDANTGAQILLLKGHARQVSSVAITPDGSRIATGSEDNTARVWDGTTGMELALLEGHTGRIVGVALSADGRHIATASVDGTARLWDVLSGKQIAEIVSREGSYRKKFSSVAITPDGTYAVIGSWDGTARILDARNGTELVVLRGHDETAAVTSVAISPDGTRAFTGSTDKTVRIWDAKSGKTLEVLHGHADAIWSIAVTDDGSRIVTGAGQEFATGGKDDKTVRVWNGRISHELLTLRGHTNAVTSVAITPDGDRIVSASSNNSFVHTESPTADYAARISDSQSGVELAVLAGHAGPINDIAVMPNGSRVVTVSADKTARIWDIKSGGELLVLRGHTAAVRAAVALDDGRIATGGDDGTLRIWDANSGSETAIFDLHGWISSLALMPGGRRIVVGMDDGAHVLDIQSGAELIKLKANRIRCLAVTPDGTRIITGSNDATITIWNSETGTEIGSLNTVRDDGQPKGEVNSIAVTPDGRRIVTALWNDYYPYRTVNSWDVESREKIAQIFGHAEDVMAIAAAADGRRIITGSIDKTVKVWALFESGQKLIDDAKDIVPRCLSPGERARYFLASQLPNWCEAKHKWPYDPRSAAEPVIEAGDSQLSAKNYQIAVSTFSSAINLLDRSDSDLLGRAYLGRGANDQLKNYYEAVLDFRKAEELGNSNAGDWRWWSTQRLSGQVRDARPVDALVLSMRNYLEITAEVQNKIASYNFQLGVRQIASPLGMLHGQLHADQAAATDCDRLAANPFDPFRVAPGVSFDKLDAPAAIAACTAAIESDRKEGRYLLQRARSYSKAADDSKDDQAIANQHIMAARQDLTAATALGYPIAFNNMAIVYEDGNDSYKAAALVIEFLNRVTLCCAPPVVRKLFDDQAPQDENLTKVIAALLGWAADLGNGPAHEMLATLTLERRLSSPAGIDARAFALTHYRIAAALYSAAGAATESRNARARADGLKGELPTTEIAAAEALARSWRKANIASLPPWVEDESDIRKRGDKYLEEGDFDRAIAAYTDALRRDPKRAQTYGSRAFAHLAKAQYERAIADYDEAIRLDARYAFAYFARGIANFFFDVPPKALADLEQARKIEPKDAYVALWLDIVSKRSNSPSHLSELSEQIDMTEWPAPVVQLFLGQLTTADVLKAAELPEAKRKGQLCEANFFLGEIALRQNTKDEAVRLFRRAVADCPKNFIEGAAARAELTAIGAPP